MSDWENDDVGPAPAPLPSRRRFEDEDVEEDDIKDDWEEEDEEPPKPAPAPEPKKRLSVKQKIAEKEAQRQQNTGNDFDDWDLEDDGEDDDERRRQEKEAQMRSDLDNAAALLGASSLDEKKTAAGAAVPSSLADAKPTSKDEWEAFATELYQTLVQPKASRPGFDKYFFPHLITLLTTNGLRDVDMRKGATKLRELAEAKVRADKEAKKTGGNVKRPAAKPKQVGTSSAKNTIDLKAYGDEALDDDLEFM
ncbi:unnamed protein product [Malassezia sympodialis ATCC 42132]|uniref:Eukaryotic translation initiation factor 3 30 kDa subunit n=1 Tax=Malassezia sympodialis (strain ATCC 42132) TaxID=1230383 RepID=M5E7I0_MALS4|nr:uncharacterized protein MSY001_1139 [Malassezia sympodialis ATCC 42132]CCU98433.1 unnamed protein product [Malassezia sympodialis ATCC 42132]SHO75734.1 Uncharacterized protein MSYG_0065 [Malassezia sympodialis ATCC 42132]|eukprot:XP_018739740.1 uncharacterized protein MSY001_1139 [Malassezia sympodialis ATCC 42132]